MGRIGNYEKNTDMILDAAKITDLKDWKIVLVGPMTDSFITKGTSKYAEYVKQYFKDNPSLKEKVIFIGPEYDPKRLFEYYVKSRVFLLTSRSEGFANASIVSNNWQFGCKLPQEDALYLSKVLTDIIEEKQDIDPDKRLSFNELSYSNILSKKVLSKMM